MISDENAKAYVSANIQRLLHASGKSAYWLMKELGAKQGTLYPVVNGQVVPSIAMTARIAECLNVTVDELLKPVKPNRKNSAILA